MHLTAAGLPVTPHGMKKLKTVGIVVLIGFFLVLVALYFIGTNLPPSSQPTQSATTTSSAPTIATPTPTKTMQTLHEGTSSTVDIGVSKEAEQAVFKALSAEDRVGYDQLTQGGQVFEVSAGTEVQVIDTSSGYDRVRFAAGPHVGESGWVVAEWVR